MFIPAALAAEAVEHTSVVGQVAGTFGLDWQLFLAQLLNFAIVVFVFSKFLYQPLRRFMKDREARIAAGLDKEKLFSKKLEDVAAEREAVLSAARDEGRALMATMKAQGDAMIEKARRDAEVMLGQARDRAAKEAEQIKTEAMADVRAAAAELVVMAAEKVLREKIDQKADRVLVERALKDMKL